MQTTERHYALDAVRAFALLAGLVLHAAMTFLPGLAAAGFPADSSQSPALQVACYVIHVFRMSLFYFIAGYFAHLAFHRKGSTEFIKDRARRIGIPLLAGWIVFGPIALVVVLLTLAPRPAGEPPPMPGGFPFAHLWFLYYLALIYVAALSLRWWITRTLGRSGALCKLADTCMRFAVRSGTAPLLIAAPLAACLYFTPNWAMWGGIPTPDRGFTPQVPAMIGFGSAFVVGWLLRRQSELLAVWRRRWIMHLALASVLTLVSLALLDFTFDPFDVTAEPSLKLAYAASYSAAIWCWVPAVIGAALRFAAHENRTIRYLADASYWIYIAHLPIALALALTVLDWPLHWSIKLPLIIGATLALTLSSYHYWVRGTIIGQILNGRRIARRRAGRSAAPAMSKEGA